MATITMRSFAGERDLEPLVALINACEEHDKLDMGTSLGELRVELNVPELDQQRDLRLWEDNEGALAAFARMSSRRLESGGYDVNFWFTVHPAARGRGLEQAVLQFGEARAREIGREKGAPIQFRADIRDTDPWRRSLVEQAGYHPVRYFLRMQRSLDEPLPELQLPPGFSLRSTAREELPAWVELYNQSFVDHWNFHPLSVELAQYYFENVPEYERSGDLVAVAPDGTLAAFSLNIIHRDDNRRTGRKEGWVQLLGTRRGYRKLGLGRAVLVGALHWIKEQGMDIAMLGVDAENPTGATRLYESVGFRPSAAFTTYSRTL